jgi:hypothetical protein
MFVPGPIVVSVDAPAERWQCFERLEEAARYKGRLDSQGRTVLGSG